MLGVKAVDDKTLQISLTKTVPYCISMLGHTSLEPPAPRFTHKLKAPIDRDSALIPVIITSVCDRENLGWAGFIGKDPLDFIDLKNLYVIEQQKGYTLSH